MTRRRDGARRAIAAAVLFVVSAGFAILGPYVTPANAVAASNEGWTLKAPATSPAARYGAVSAYDPATSQLIMFGGRDGSGTSLNDTWNWTGSTWQQLSPSAAPSARLYASMAYDPAIGKLVLFGGAAGAYQNDTWTWDGATWTKLAASGPSIRYSASMTFDPTTGRLILFGGVTTGSAYLNDTWSFDGTSWTQLSTATTGTPPSGRGQAAFVFDQATGSAVLFGGSNGGSGLGDTWTFANNAWAQQNPATSPQVTYSSSSAFDPVSGQVVLFEPGYTTTWTWNGTTWASAAGGPGGRGYTTLSYDPRAGQAVLFSGYQSGKSTNETWTWGPSVTTTTTWTSVSPGTSPQARSDTEMAYDPATAQMLLYGGSGSAAYSDTWVWSGSTWTKLSPSTTPTLSDNPALAFDDATSQLILFGGRDTGGTVSNFTYSWTGSNWVKLAPASSPPARWGASLGYDPISNQLILFGGADASNNAFADTWAWTGSNWVQLSPSTSPPARIQAPLTFDPNGGRLLLFGGEGSGSSYPNLGDTWTWTGSNWVKLTPATSPAARGGDTNMMVYDPVIGRVVLFGGFNFSSNTSYADTWTWTGSNWVQISPTSSPTARNAAMMAFDPRSGQIVLFGGDTGSKVNSTYLFNVTVNAFPTLTTSSSLSLSTTLNGYDQHIQAAQTVSVPVPTGSNWNVSLAANNQLTSGSNTLPALTVNGSSSNYAATTAPVVTSTGTVPTSTGAVSYPVTVSLAGNAVVYGANANTGSGTVSIPLNFWATVPATAAAGTYTNVLTVSTNFGP